jgi:hypothetical protein
MALGIVVWCEMKCDISHNLQDKEAVFYEIFGPHGSENDVVLLGCDAV